MSVGVGVGVGVEVGVGVGVGVEVGVGVSRLHRYLASLNDWSNEGRVCVTLVNLQRISQA